MNTKLLLSASAVVMGAAGIAGTFAPQELAGAFGIATGGMVVLLVQLLAAAWLAFAMTNWTARGSLMGGIYNRPGAIGNLTHFVIGSVRAGKRGRLGKGRTSNSDRGGRVRGVRHCIRNGVLPQPRGPRERLIAFASEPLEQGGDLRFIRRPP